jgi:diaminopropionate ammonia-lyase
VSAAPGRTAGEVFLNPAARAAAATAPPRAPLGLHRRLPGYAVTPLRDAPALARANGVGRVWVKDESSRLGLPAFKMLGASWAAYRALVARLGRDPEPWADVEELRRTLAPLRPLTLATATDGNHGRAVARMAALLGLDADVYVPRGTTAARIAAIEGEGAGVTVVDGDYDRAVAAAAATADDRCLAIQDVGWPGYEQVPAWVVDGYATIFWEVDDQLAARGEEGPDVVVVPVGVGGLAAAAVRHWRHRGRLSHQGTPMGFPGPLRRPPRLLGVEPLAAACVLRSLRAGRIVTVPGPHDSIMAGLNCGTPSLVAWPFLRAGLDAVVAVADGRARQAMRDLAAAGIVAGETGAASLAGLAEATGGREAGGLRRVLGLGAQARVLLLCTEGATDPEAYRRIVGGTRP